MRVRTATAISQPVLTISMHEHWALRVRISELPLHSLLNGIYACCRAAAAGGITDSKSQCGSIMCRSDGVSVEESGDCSDASGSEDEVAPAAAYGDQLYWNQRYAEEVREGKAAKFYDWYFGATLLCRPCGQQVHHICGLLPSLAGAVLAVLAAMPAMPATLRRGGMRLERKQSREVAAGMHTAGIGSPDRTAWVAEVPPRFGLQHQRRLGAAAGYETPALRDLLRRLIPRCASVLQVRWLPRASDLQAMPPACGAGPAPLTRPRPPVPAPPGRGQCLNPPEPPCSAVDGCAGGGGHQHAANGDGGGWLSQHCQHRLLRHCGIPPPPPSFPLPSAWHNAFVVTAASFTRHSSQTLS